MTDMPIREVRVAIGDGFSTFMTLRDGVASWSAGADEIIEAPLDDLLAAWAKTIGKPLRTWPQWFGQVGLSIEIAPDYNTQRANAIKALGLFCVWIEPAIRRGTGLESMLFDEVIVDYTGAPGQQPYIYVLPERQQQETPAHARLFQLGLLAKFTLQGQSEGQRWFKPLVTPIIRVEQLGIAERLWARTKDDMRAALRRAAGGQR